MDSLIIRKVWNDFEMLEIDVAVRTKKISIRQPYYSQEEQLSHLRSKLDMYLKDTAVEVKLSFGILAGLQDDAVSMKILPARSTGQVFIKVTMFLEYSVFAEKRYFSKVDFFFVSHIESLVTFSKDLLKVTEGEIGATIVLPGSE